MAHFKKQKQSMCKSKKNYNKKSSKSYVVRKHRTQRGGVSNACTLDVSTNGGSNFHNTNPQASLDLDNKYMAYGGPVPLGSNILQGGSNKCGDEGVGTSKSKNSTFQQYLDGVNQQLDLNMGGGAQESPVYTEPLPSYNNAIGAEQFDNPDQAVTNEPPPSYINTNISISEDIENIPKQKIQNSKHRNGTLLSTKKYILNKTQTGGGFSTDPSEFIAGQPVYKPYDDCCPPAIINGNLKFGAPDQPICGFGAVRGGSRKTKRQYSKTNNGKKGKSKQHGSKARKQKQHGGDWNSVGKSKPAMFSDAFNGQKSVFAYPDDMSKRTFDETQPNYSVNAI